MVTLCPCPLTDRSYVRRDVAALVASATRSASRRRRAVVRVHPDTTVCRGRCRRRRRFVHRDGTVLATRLSVLRARKGHLVQHRV